MSANFAQAISSAALAAGGASLTLATPSAPFTVPVDGAGRITLIDHPALPTVMEIVSYTGRTDNGNGTFTYTGLTRGLEGTTARAWPAGSYCLQSLTAGQYAADLASKAASSHTHTSAQVSGLGTAATKNITISTAAASGGADGDVWLKV